MFSYYIHRQDQEFKCEMVMMIRSPRGIASLGAVCFSLLVLLSCSSATKKNTLNSDSGIIYGPGFAFALTAPEGWRLDETAAKENDLFAAVLPDGKSWKKAEVRMYASIVRLDSSNNESIQTVMERDAKYFNNNSKSLQITDIDTVNFGEQRIYLRSIKGVEKEPYKIIGYADEKNLVVLIGMGSTNQSLYEDNLKNFRALLASFRFFEKQSRFITPQE